MSSSPRTAILDAAGEVFARFGFKKASVEDIARRAGVGKGSIYLHFESKESLFEASLQVSHAHALSELEASIRGVSTPEAQVRAFIECKRLQSTRGPMGHRIELGTLFELGAQAANYVPRMREAEARILARVIEDGVAQGVFVAAQPFRVALGFVELLMMLTVRTMTQLPDAPDTQALDACFEVFIRGLVARTAPARGKR
ncbi:Transcriptional regulator, TetR family [Myxococcus hansupus]|uniref:Transcriptional regulator, TetR family n=1 Tax=Pseudomyxococcus hansupus TaxID=1297742 RepID=A0A0H4XCM5_9BACT|nr:TetR/AcrR family transcriptional regulator [Myxococcus hansupus]AKQ65737.1 Transcriptional regulator, TetR family [Myxococcus hansupus]